MRKAYRDGTSGACVGVTAKRQRGQQVKVGLQIVAQVLHFIRFELDVNIAFTLPVAYANLILDNNADHQ